MTPPVEGPTEVNLGTDPKLWVRATAPAKWSVSDSRFGKIEVIVGTGEVPATVLPVRWARGGIRLSFPRPGSSAPRTGISPPLIGPLLALRP